MKTLLPIAVSTVCVFPLPLKTSDPPIPVVLVLSNDPFPLIFPDTSARIPEARLRVPAALILLTNMSPLKFPVVPLVRANVPSLLKLLAITMFIV